ncbi:MAG: VCBS repeat-containing protein [Bacteroidota bacterium]
MGSNMYIQIPVPYLFLLLVICACKTEEQRVIPQNQPMFQVVPSAKSQVSFANNLTENSRINVLEYLYYYNGCGVSIGDINNDGLPDIYLASATKQNKLYLNKGNLEFQDITASANAGGYHGITAGVNFIDINQDGFLDIYICKSGNNAGRYRTNELLINTGDLQFEEKAAEYGLDDPSFSTQSYFFDYDVDGDLDMYLVNHPIDWNNKNIIMTEEQEQVGFLYEYSDKLYENDGSNHFSDITQEAGILNRAWGLSASIGDFNGDRLPDLYVANDFIKPDFLYINNGDGTFSDRLPEYFRHISFYSMGSDYADINNDGLNDLYVLDMAMRSHARSKQNMGSMSTENFQTIIQRGYHYPYSSNTLHLNLGSQVPFTDIAQLAGVDKTDWSWAPLLIDLDNDGFKDIFVSNGIYRDIIDNDFQIKKVAYDDTTDNTQYFEDLLADIPQTKVRNFFFRNSGDLSFEDVSEAWGITEATNSNGAAYADLDLDGDLDLVTNNLNEPSAIYENLSESTSQNNYLQVELRGSKTNRNGIGASLEIAYKGQIQRQDAFVARGYLSSSEYKLHFGLGKEKEIDRLTINWPDGKQSIVKGVAVNTLVTVDYSDAVVPGQNGNSLEQPWVEDITALLGLQHLHEEAVYNDFQQELLLPHKLSENGPFVSVADVDNNGYEDFYVGGAAGFPGALYLQSSTGSFTANSSMTWIQDKQFEDQKSLFFDADNDGDLDLYVVSGSNEFDRVENYQDRLYANDGIGNFQRLNAALPPISSSGLSVDAADYDKDGDLDLAVGGRVVPGAYPRAPQSYLLENDKGRFKDVTLDRAQDFQEIGMVTDLLFTDFDGDLDPDLMIVGEWMGIRFLENEGGSFSESEVGMGVENTEGWWFQIAEGDIDRDGDPDYLVGNIGQNNKYHPTLDKPLTLYFNDFDENGTGDIVLSKKENDTFYPVRGRECTSQQMPFVAEKFESYASFASATLEEIYTLSHLNQSLKMEAKEFRNCLLVNEGAGMFTLKPLPLWAQMSPVTGAEFMDFNEDGTLDLILAGNFFGSETETIRYDGGSGLLMIGDGTGNFDPISPRKSGFMATQNVKDLAKIKLANGSYALIVANNKNALQVWGIVTPN